METGSGALDGVLAPVTKGGSWNSATRAAYPVLKQTVWNKFDPGYDGYWGAATASILWCEEGYSTSYYVAEWVNSLSNITFGRQRLATTAAADASSGPGDPRHHSDPPQQAADPIRPGQRGNARDRNWVLPLPRRASLTRRCDY